MLWLPVSGWPYLVGVLWNPMVQSLITWAVCSENVPCVFVGPPVVSSLGCCWPICVWGQPSGWLTVISMPTTVYKLLCRCWPHEVEFASERSGACWNLPFDMLLVKLIGSCSDVLWSWPLRMLVLEPLERDFGAGKCQMLPVTSSGQSVWCYKAIHSVWLPLLGLSVYRKDQATHQGVLLPALGPGTGQQKSQGTLKSASACLHLSTACQCQ